MNKSFLFSLLITIITLSGCKDETAPTITLEGETEVESSLNKEYEDQGATATDDEDGDISDQIVSDGVVDIDLVGDYKIVYGVMDESGNDADPVTRTVLVRNEIDHLDGVYFISANLAFGTGTGTSTSSAPASDKIKASETINNRFHLDAFPVYCNVQGTEIDIPTQGITGNSWSGEGTVEADGSLKIHLYHDNSWGGQAEYELHYIK